MPDSIDELLTFGDDEPSTSAPPELHWQVLIVDDEPDVHAATQLALRGLHIEDRPLAFTHAHSAAEALTLLKQRQDFAVALIDVVMETDDAGLKLVRTIREQLGNSMLRIILRTGQPGYAPEIDTIRQYDINDYRTKTELTRVRLFTSVTLAVRAHAQLQQLESSRHGLEQILTAAGELGQPSGLKKFVAGIVTQLCALLKVSESCLVCAVVNAPQSEPVVLAAAGSCADWMGMPLQELPDPRVRLQLERTLSARQHLLSEGICVYVPGTKGQAIAAFVDLQRPLDEVERRLLEVFCSNISIAFENLQLHLNVSELAFHDGLVRLPNRHAFIASLNERDEPNQVVALMDLDNFSYINSVLDDAFGDRVLQAVADRLTRAFQGCHCVARVGGDLFALHGPADLIQPDRIASVFASPFTIDQSEPLRLSATTGLIVISDPAQPAVETLKNAGVALKQAKHFNRGKTLTFRSELADAARDRMTLLSRLRTAFSSERLHLNFQPFIHLASNRVVGAECLLRWQTEEGRFVPPDQFIPLAEQSGLMVALGEWVVRTALRWRAGLKGVVDDDFRVAINVSQMQFNEPDFVESLLDAMHEQGLSGHQVEVELTESVAVGQVHLISERINQLRQHGVRIAMDDFGTGYSSLSILQQLSIDRLKIDRSFVSGTKSGPQSLGIVRTITALAQHLQLSTIAEGIETELQRTCLMELGCEEGQGYLFSKPLDEASFHRFLISHRTE